MSYNDLWSELQREQEERNRNAWYVVKNGDILFKGTENECGEMIAISMDGQLEMYPAEAYCRPY